MYGRLASLLFVLLFPLSLLAQQPNAKLKAKYELFWSDEFDGSELDTTKWRHRYLGPRANAVVTRDAVKVQDGFLTITAHKHGDEFHTGMLGTQETFTTVYGYFECKVKFQEETGSTAAFWFQSPTFGGVGDSRKYGAEIDVFEYRLKAPTHSGHSIHWDGYKDDHKRESHMTRSKDYGEGWHTFGLEWTKDSYTFYVDGKKTWKTSAGMSSTDQYMILSFEIQDWAGDIKKANLPDAVTYDYVRVWKENK